MEQAAQSLLPEIKKLNKNISRLVARQSYASSFLRGIVSGLGSVLGATIVVGLIAYLLSNIDVVPIIGNWLAEISQHVIEQLPSGQ